MLLQHGTRLHVEEAGPKSAPVTLVFAHGVAVNLHTWDAVRAHLASADVRQIYYDHRGFGLSDAWNGERPTITQLGQDLGEIVDSLRGPVILIGHSMGTLTIQALAAGRPELFGPRIVGTLLLGAPGGGAFITGGFPYPMRHVARRAPLLLATMSRLRIDGHFARAQNPMGVRIAHARSTPQMRLEMLTQLGGTPVRTLTAYAGAVFECELGIGAEALAGVATTVVSGRRDRLVSVRGGRALAAAIAGSTYIELPEVGHMIQAEAPERVHRLVDDLIATSVSGTTDAD